MFCKNVIIDFYFEKDAYSTRVLSDVFGNILVYILEAQVC